MDHGWQIKASVDKSRSAGRVPLNVVFFEGGRFSNTPAEDSPRRFDLNQQRGFHTGFLFPCFFEYSPNFSAVFFWCLDIKGPFVSSLFRRGGKNIRSVY